MNRSVDSQMDDNYDHDHSPESMNTVGDTTGNGLPQRPPPRKRNRLALSCTSCRERKIKCDRKTPCDQCTKRGEVHFCHIEAAKPKPAGLGPSPSAGDGRTGGESEVSAIKARLAQLEALLTQQANGDGGSISRDASFSSVSSLSPINSSSAPTPLTNVYSIAHQQQMQQQQQQQQQMQHQGQHNANLPSYALAPRTFSPSVSNLLSPMSSGPASLQQYRVGTPAQSSQRSSYSTNVSAARPRQTSEDSSNAHHSPAPSSSSAGFAAIKADGTVDTDTEDAALVLEGLAMGTGGIRARGVKSETTRTVQGIQQPNKTIERYLAVDKDRDLLDGGAAMIVDPEGEAAFNECTARKAALKAEGGGKCPRVDMTEEEIRKDPGKAKITKLACEHDGLFRLKFGPETLLGWGMGWAFAAADEAGEFRTIDKERMGYHGAPEREAVLRVIIHALPSKEVAEQLLFIYESRVKSLAHHVVHVPTLRKEMQAFYELDSVEKRARVIDLVDPGWLGMFLMVLVLGLRFYPCYPPQDWVPMTHLFDGRTIHMWHSAAKTCLILARYQSSMSISVLQTIIFLHLHGADAGRSTLGLLRVAITNAQEMGIHRLGDKSNAPVPGEAASVVIRREVAKRVWWALVFRDWCGAIACSSVYIVNPKHFNTPYPGNYNDEDLFQTPTPSPRPISEYTEMSYSLSSYDLAHAMRENVDRVNERELSAAAGLTHDGQQNGLDGKDVSASKRLSEDDEAYLDSRYRRVLENAPSFFHIGSEEGAGTDMEIHRWLLQQAVFSKLLRIHRSKLTSVAKSRTSCVLLARSILDMQKKIRSRCTIVDRLWFNLMQSFSAAIILCLDLLHTRPPATMRVLIRSEIGEALQALRHIDSTNYTARKSIRVLEALMAEEEDRWKASQADGKEDPTKAGAKRKRGADAAREGKKSLLSLALRVARATQCGQAPPDESCQPRDCGEQLISKRSMEYGGRTNVDDTVMIEDPTSSGHLTKDLISKGLMDSLMNPPTSTDPSPLTFPWANTLNQSTSEFDPQRFAPNGVESTMPLTPPDGQPFDLHAFLAQCEASPASTASTDETSSRGMERNGSYTSNNSASTTPSNVYSTPPTLNHQDSYGSSSNGKGNSNNSGSSTNLNESVKGKANDPFEGAIGLDSFWTWVLSQGAPGQSGPGAVPTFDGNPASQTQTSSNAVVEPPTTGVNPTPALAAPPASPGPNGNTTFTRAPSSPWVWGLSQSSKGPNAAPSPAYGALPASPKAAVPPGAAAAAAAVASVGTPSAGFDSWLQTPNLFDLCNGSGGFMDPTTPNASQA